MIEKLYTLYLIISFIAIGMLSCNSSKSLFDPSNESSVITFGNGGGFTGKITQYALTPKGSIFVQDNLEWKLLKKIDVNLATQIFKNYKILQLDKLSLNQPGNRYFFIEIQDKDVSTRIVWNGEMEVNNLDVFYKILMNTAKTN